MRMLGKTTLRHLTWCHTKALMAASSQKTDLVDNLWKIKSSRYEKHAQLDDTSMQVSEGPQELRRPNHFIRNLTNTSTSTNSASGPADITPSLTNFKCNVCGRVYKNRKFLNMHFKKSSNCHVRTSGLPGFLPPEPEPPPKPKALKPDSGARPYVCANCNKSFKTANELGKHRKRSEKCISSRGEQEEEYRLTMEIIKALGVEGPFVFPEPKVMKEKVVEKKIRERKNVLWWQEDLES